MINENKISFDDIFENFHIIIITLFYSFFFVFQDFNLNVTLGTILLTILLMIYYLKHISSFFDFKYSFTNFTIIFLMFFQIFVNVRHIELFTSIPLYFYGIIIFMLTIPNLMENKKIVKIILFIMLMPSLLASFIAIISKLAPSIYEQHILTFMSQSSIDKYYYLKNEGYAGMLGANISLTANYISVGCLIFTYSMLKKINIKNTLCAIFCFFALLLLNRRGELLACLLTICIMSTIVDHKYRSFFRVMIYGFIPLVALSFVLLINFKVLTYSGDNRLITLVFDLFSFNKNVDISNGRFDLYNLAFKLFSEHFWFGIGWGEFRYFGSQLISQVTNVHNIYLQLLCEDGIIGFTIFMINIVIFLVYLIKKLVHNENYASVFSLFYLIYLLIVGMFDNPLFQDQFWILITILFSISILDSGCSIDSEKEC